MEKLEVAIEPTATNYRIVLQKSRLLLKTTKVDYIADLIKERGIFFLHDYFMRISPEEKAALGNHHYKRIALDKLKQSGQYLMADKLKHATVTHRMTRINHLHEEEYFIIFSSNLQVNVTPLHYRLFACKPLFKHSVKFEQTELAI